MTLHRPIHPSNPASRAQEARARSIANAVAAHDAGDLDGAAAILTGLLECDPDWIEGYRPTAELLWQCGTPDQFEEWLCDSVRRGVGNIDVAITCLTMLSDTGFHRAVETLVPVVRAWAGNHRFFTMLTAVAASEQGDVARADALFDRATEQGERLALPHVGHLIRTARAGEAAMIAEKFVQAEPDNQAAWGFLATAWRMLDDPRHDWLVMQPGLVRCIDMDVEPEALDALARRLRTLHVARTHPFDMSLRGGTQTAGNILERREPEIATLRLGLFSALYHYVAKLPPEDMRHPLLSRRRDPLQFSSSWSVRLLGGGYHVSHIHPIGSLSAAFYVALPPACADQPQAGWLTIGEPPVDLNTALPPLQQIEPKLGRLVLFPSYMWHGTRPFPDGERITVAFDTLMPAARTDDEPAA